MGRILLRSKIHRAIVTEANKDYFGSITIDEDLLDAADIKKFEQVHVLSVTSGDRLITYVIPGDRGSGVICMNGAAAHKINQGHIVIIIAYCNVPENEIGNVNPKVVLIKERNRIDKIVDGHQHVLNIPKK